MAVPVISTLEPDRVTDVTEIDGGSRVDDRRRAGLPQRVDVRPVVERARSLEAKFRNSPPVAHVRKASSWSATSSGDRARSKSSCPASIQTNGETKTRDDA